MTLKMQNYMEKHKIGPLFEDLMNKVLRDLPDDPLIYVIKAVYKKAGLDIPQDIRYGGMRRSASDLTRGRSRSPEKHPVSSSTDAALTRDYDKPWKSPAKRLKPKTSGDEAEVSRSRRQRRDWNNDVRVKTTSFDELWEDTSPTRKEEPVRRSEPAGIMKKAWASVGLDDDDLEYTSSKYTGPRRARFASDEDLLAAETIQPSRGSEVRTKPHSKRSNARSQKLRAVSHRQELERLLQESDKRSVDSGYMGETWEDEDEEEAIELLEDADDLRREGVTNIPAAGYRLSRVMRQRREEPTVKLNINLYPRPEPSPSVQGDAYEDLQEYEDESDRELRDYQPRTRKGRHYDGDSEDEFESVSQVTGPRHPVWNIPDSDGESYIPRPAFTTPQPSRSKKRPPHGNRLSSTGPARYHVQSAGQSIESVDDFTQEGVKTWTPGSGRTSQRVMSPDGDLEVRESLQSARGGGWGYPDDSDASVTDFSHRQGSSQRQPRAY